MWSRAELKRSAKENLKKNYWWVVLVAIIFSVVAGSGVNQVFQYRLDNSFQKTLYGTQQQYGDYLYGFGSGSDSYFDNGVSDNDALYDYFDENTSDNQFGITPDYNKIINMISESSQLKSIAAIVFIVTILLSIFVFAPLGVGCRRWFLKNRTIKPQMNEVVYPFSNGYLNTVKVMFFKGLYTALWSLLFVIPGVIKAYEYRMIPYLLAENPNMDMNEAFNRSKNMMYGNKWDAFVLDLSFIGWYILTSFIGIVGIFWVNPYVELTSVELYVALCGGSNKKVNFDNGYNNGYGNGYGNGYNNDFNGYN